MSTRKKIESCLKEYGIKLPVDSFVREVSNIYHSYESLSYDARQKGISESAKNLVEAINYIDEYSQENLVVLDFGCGTGHATFQLLNSKISSKIAKIICFDQSPEMVALAKSKIEKNTNNSIKFEYFSNTSGFEEIKKLQFDIIITNALLHHIIDLGDTLNILSKIIKNNGILIIGHEPNSRFYQNKELLKATRKFQRQKKWKKVFKLSFWKRKFGKGQSQKSLPQLTNDKLLEKGLIENQLPLSIITKLVDIHVPIGLSIDQVWGEIGFNGPDLIREHLQNFLLIKEFSYSHIKDDKVYDSKFWTKLSSRLSHKFPLDGADCIMILRQS